MQVIFLTRAPLTLTFLWLEPSWHCGTFTSLDSLALNASSHPEVIVTTKTTPSYFQLSPGLGEHRPRLRTC